MSKAALILPFMELHDVPPFKEASSKTAYSPNPQIMLAISFLWLRISPVSCGQQARFWGGLLPLLHDFLGIPSYKGDTLKTLANRAFLEDFNKYLLLDI